MWAILGEKPGDGFSDSGNRTMSGERGRTRSSAKDGSVREPTGFGTYGLRERLTSLRCGISARPRFHRARLRIGLGREH
jgi:hypothetical protein